METRKNISIGGKPMPQTETWWKESVIYQIYPRSFNDSNDDGIGDVNGIREKLDYLKNLGVDVLWISPIYRSPNADNGYDISDYQAIMDEFGTMEDFDQLLEESHQKGIKIVMDLVVNHTSDEHRWFIESKKSKENPYHDYYIWKDGEKNQPPNNWGSAFSGSAWKYNEELGQWYLHLFAEKQPDLNWENEKVRQSVYDMMTWWFEKGIDGFRMDVISLISKDQDFKDGETFSGLYGNSMEFCCNGPRIHEFLKEMNDKVLSKYDVVTVGEAPGVTIEEAKKYTGKDENELNMVFQFEMMGIDHGKYGKWTPVPFRLKDMKANFEKWQKGLDGSGWNSLYWDNHDQPRIVSRWGNDTGQWREKSAKMLALCLHMHQGTPYIYQGEEIGMTNVRFASIDDYQDIEILNAYQELVKEKKVLTEEQFMEGVYKLSRDNARTPMQWSAEKNSGFSNGDPWLNVNPNYAEINVANQINDPDSVFSFYKQLIELRHHNKVMVYGNYEQYLKEDENVYVFTREYEEKKLLVLCNFSDRNQEIQLPSFLVEEEYTVLISNDNDTSKCLTENMVLLPYEGVAFIK